VISGLGNGETKRLLLLTAGGWIRVGEQSLSESFVAEELVDGFLVFERATTSAKTIGTNISFNIVYATVIKFDFLLIILNYAEYLNQTFENYYEQKDFDK